MCRRHIHENKANVCKGHSLTQSAVWVLYHVTCSNRSDREEFYDIITASIKYILGTRNLVPYKKVGDTEKKRICFCENIVKLKIGLLANKLFMNPTTVPVTNVHNYNTRNAARCNFYRPQIRTNYGKFTFKYSASVLWEGIPTCLKKISTTNGSKRQYKINLMINQWWCHSLFKLFS